MDELFNKGLERFLKYEKRYVRRNAFHEIGHAVAMYVCYGNIERIEEIDVSYFNPNTEHSNPMSDFEYRDRVQDLDNGFEFLLNELCYSIGGGLCEAIFCNKIAYKIIDGDKYKFPIKGMEGDIEQVKTMLAWYGVFEEKEIKSFINVAVRRLFPFYMEYSDKIKELVNYVLKDDADIISREDFYYVFDQKLYRKERRERKKRMAQYRK